MLGRPIVIETGAQKSPGDTRLQISRLWCEQINWSLRGPGRAGSLAARALMMDGDRRVCLKSAVCEDSNQANHPPAKQAWKRVWPSSSGIISVATLYTDHSIII